jgi:S1-C subfamily serine protease
MPGQLRAQVDRADLVNRGIEHYLDFQSDSAIAYLVAAVDPSIDAEVTQLKRGVQFLAQTLLSEGEENLANLWMRWAVRHFGEMQIDSAEFDDPESIGNAYFAAVGFVGASEVADTLVRTSWEWPGFGVPENSGTVRLDQVGLTPAVTVAIAGRDTIQLGRSLTLPPGSYVLEASAVGYEPVQTTREVLPGVAVVLGFDLVPIVAEEVALAPDVLPPDVESVVRDGVARFTATRFGTEPICGTGFFVGGDGLLLTTYAAIRGAEDLEVTLPDGTSVSDDIGVAAWDTRSNVALLKLPVSRTDSLPLSSDVADDQWTWVLTHPSCGSTAVSPNRVAQWLDRPAGTLQLTDSMAFASQGGPIIDQSGAVIGLSTGPLSAVPADHVSQSLVAARSNIENGRLTALTVVASEENHLYGSVMIRSTFENAIATVTPLESWHWAKLAGGGPVPLTFTGPLGRYQLDLQAVGETPHQAEFAIDPGVLKEIVEPQIVATSGGGFPWPIALLGAAGAAVAGVLALGGGDGGDHGGNGGSPIDDNATITVIVPQIR